MPGSQLVRRADFWYRADLRDAATTAGSRSIRYPPFIAWSRQADLQKEYRNRVRKTRMMPLEAITNLLIACKQV